MKHKQIIHSAGILTASAFLVGTISHFTYAEAFKVALGFLLFFIVMDWLNK